METISIGRSDLTSSASGTLIEALNAELSDLYHEPGANHFARDMIGPAAPSPANASRRRGVRAGTPGPSVYRAVVYVDAAASVEGRAAPGAP